jgi:hypothetical protein
VPADAPQLDRTRASSSRKLGSPLRSVRSTTRLMNSPMSGATSGTARPPTGLPTTTSVCPEYRASNAFSPASNVMYRVAPSR